MHMSLCPALASYSVHKSMCFMRSGKLFLLELLRFIYFRGTLSVWICLKLYSLMYSLSLLLVYNKSVT